MENVILYTTSGCHLCEQAETLLLPLVQSGRLCCELVDIADSESLLERYGVRIPVVYRPANDSELGWPFDFSQLQDFLQG